MSQRAIRVFPHGDPATPLSLIVLHIPLNGGCATSITRTWEDRTRVSCGGLCPVDRCTFSDGVCVIGEPKYVPASACAAFGGA